MAKVVPATYYKGFPTKADHDRAHQLVRLRQDHPQAPDRATRSALKDLLFLCHYREGHCDYDRFLDKHPWVGPWPK